MNERMKSIGQQAGLVFIEDGVYGQRWYSSKCGLDESEYENLVKLIVSECANTIQSNRWAKDNQAWSKGMRYSAKLIKEHFGVEE